MNSTKSNGKEKRMFVLKTNIPEIDTENDSLFKAAAYLQMCGNNPGLLMADFYEILIAEGEGLSKEQFGRLTTAAVAIETMMESGFETFDIENEITIH